MVTGLGLTPQSTCAVSQPLIMFDQVLKVSALTRFYCVLVLAAAAAWVPQMHTFKLHKYHVCCVDKSKQLIFHQQDICAYRKLF